MYATVIPHLGPHQITSPLRRDTSSPTQQPAVDSLRLKNAQGQATQTEPIDDQLDDTALLTQPCKRLGAFL